MTDSVQARYERLGHESKTVLIGVLEALEGLELVEQARLVLGVRESAREESWGTMSIGPQGLNIAPDADPPPLKVGYHSKSEQKRVEVLRAAQRGEYRVDDETPAKFGRNQREPGRRYRKLPSGRTVAICSVPGCDHSVRARRRCRHHLHELEKAGG